MTARTQVRLAHQIMLAAHAGQTDKAGMPYHTHPQRVASRLLELPNLPVFVHAAALLHDVIEDTPYTADILMDRGIDARTVTLVQHVTRKREGETYREFIRRIATCGDPWAIRLKLADIADNTSRPLPPELAGLHRRYWKAKKVLEAALATYKEAQAVQTYKGKYNTATVFSDDVEYAAVEQIHRFLPQGEGDARSRLLQQADARGRRLDLVRRQGHVGRGSDGVPAPEGHHGVADRNGRRPAGNEADLQLQGRR